ncbi:phage tail protein [Hymenobacter latericus]|uniref:phage tail protein n=1 Tax=Hymenobacter sp. YIM 151858-1 TaxID=2987688 RepID=UPI002226D764|nr:tail fiber protein [Hymenobacter sp. YIM 151858-1]UYZ58195.1 tail fiber protein [Hymenobacter sp. YIM 151858-1]
MRLIATQQGLQNIQQVVGQAEPTRRSWLKRLGAVLGGSLLAGPAAATATRQAYRTTGMEPFIGEIMLFAGNYEVQGYMFCNGQILSIAQNTALYSILGTMYGGDGRTTFALPDLRGRVPLHYGQGPGRSQYTMASAGGSENTTLLANQMPAHVHSAPGSVSSGAATTNSPVGAVPAVLSATDVNGESVSVKGYAATGNINSTGSTGIAGNSQPFSTLQPYLALNFQIAVEGIYPSRN